MDVMRIGGLASGMDIDQIVSDLMRVERIPLDKLYQQKVLTEWKRDAYREVNTKLLALRNSAFDMLLSSKYMTRSAASSDENVVKAEAAPNAQIATYDITVNSLAAGAERLTDEAVNVRANFDAFMTQKFTDTSPDELTIQMRSTVDGEFVNVTINRNDTLEDVLAKISSSSTPGITAFYDDYANQVSFRTTATGEGVTIDFGDDLDSTDFEKVFLTSSLAWGAESDGASADLVINGITTKRDSNTFDLNGTTITLTGTTTTAVRVEVTEDVDAAYENIKAFVDLYNETIEEIYAKLDEPRYRDYPPLTDEQKEAMSDKEIELWEEKARSGMLHNDRLISGILADMRMALSSAVEGLDGTNNTLSEVGINTGLWQERGKLHIDEAKLKQALRENPEQVMALFTKDPESGSESETGLIRRLYEVVDRGIDRIGDKAGYDSSLYDQSYLSEEIRRYDERMDALEERLAEVEERYWNQFIAMEKALQQMYAQSDWLYQQLAGLTGQ